MFEKCLTEVRKYAESRPERILSISIPWRVGCGLAGDKWDECEGIIKEWANELREGCDKDITVKVYRLNDDTGKQRKRRATPITILHGTVADVCNYKPHPRRRRAL